jgi:hypothetical protein
LRVCRKGKGDISKNISMHITKKYIYVYIYMVFFVFRLKGMSR